jgi:phospholipid N-methyltransferase
MSNELDNPEGVTVRKRGVGASPNFDAGAAGHAGWPPRGASGRVAARLDDGLAFLRGFLARPLEVASVVPSSPALEARVVGAADLAHARCVVELGPGTGGTTRALLHALSPQARLLAVDLNAGFCRRLRQRITDPRLLVQQGSAEALAEHLSRWSLPAPDVVVTGIPFSTIPEPQARRIAAAISAELAPGARLVAYQLRRHVADCFSPHLGPPQAAWEWRNLPPMRVFRWVTPAG